MVNVVGHVPIVSLVLELVIPLECEDLPEISGVGNLP